MVQTFGPVLFDNQVTFSLQRADSKEWVPLRPGHSDNGRPGRSSGCQTGLRMGLHGGQSSQPWQHSDAGRCSQGERLGAVLSRYFLPLFA